MLQLGLVLLAEIGRCVVAGQRALAEMMVYAVDFRSVWLESAVMRLLLGANWLR